MASIGENTNLDKALLKENINKIDGLHSKVNEINYDLTIIVDGYEFKITELGKVTSTGEIANKLPENTPTTDAGTEVAIKDSWLTDTIRIVKTENGEEKEVTKVASVYAVSAGNGETVPVPYGFYYVGGNLKTGVVISDQESDKYGKGVEKGTDKTSHEYAPKLKGNQFVWIPCDIEGYKKYNWGGYSINSWDTSTNTAEKTQILKYGGFYVGRYEVGTSEVKFKNNLKIEDGIATSGWLNNAYIVSNTTEDSKPTSKANEIPYYSVNFETAKTMSERMYNTNSVHSGLLTGTQWDVMLNYISNEENKNISKASDENYYKDLKTDNGWGNTQDVSLNNCRGKYSSINGSVISQWKDNLEEKKIQSTWVILTTGSTEDVKKKNIYDVLGNLREATQEAVQSGYYMFRGGCILSNSSSAAACYREALPISDTGTPSGFRVALFIK